MHTVKNISKSTIHNHVKTHNYTFQTYNFIIWKLYILRHLLIITNCPNIISKLNLPIKLARLCTEIQRNVELPITKIVENYLTKQNKHKNGNKNKTDNKKVLNFKTWFTPRKHKLTSAMHTFPATNTTTATRNTQPRFKQHPSTTTTQYTQPTQTKPAFTCTKTQLLPQYTTAFPTACTDTTHLTTFTLDPKSSHAHQQYKYTLTHHTNNSSQLTKTIHTNTTQLPQNTSHKVHHKINQTNTLKPQHTTTSTPNVATVSHPILQLFH